MFGWFVLQRKVGIIIVYLLLLLCNPNPSNASKMNQSPILSQNVPQQEAAREQRGSSKVDVFRLYNAYRDRVKEGGDDAKHMGLIPLSSAVAEDDDGDDIVKSLETPKERVVADRSAKTSSGAEKTKEADKPQLPSSSVTDRNVGVAKCVPIQKPKNVDELKAKEKSDIKEPLVKGMVILKMDLPPKDRAEPSNNRGKGEGAALDSAERRIAELNRVYKEFVMAWKKPASDSKAGSFVIKPVRLTALNELMNVVENLRQPNAMDDFVKAIDDEMNREREGLTCSEKLNTNDKMKIEQATSIFKRMSKDVSAEKASDAKTGGLYDQYKSKLNEILKAHKDPQKVNAKDQSCSVAKEMKEVSQCHCDAKKSPTLSVDSDGNRISNGQAQCHCDASSFALGSDPSKLSNGVVPCHCEDVKRASLTGTADAKTNKGNEYFEALEACMQLNKEKIRNGGPKPYFITNSKQRQMVWNDIPLLAKKKLKDDANNSTDSSTNRQLNVKKIEIDPRAKSEKPSGNQKQLQLLLKVLQAKHRAPLAKRSRKRGLTGAVGFPQVLVDQVVPGQQSGNRMLDNMAKQLNVSPMEMAQRIASSSGSQLTYPVQSNSASQTIGLQVPNAATSSQKITPETAVNQQGSANVAPMLEKIMSRLQTMEDTNFNRGMEMWAADRLPCCFAEPADGAPCELTGSWESLLLGVRINIVDPHRLLKDGPKPLCARPKQRRSTSNRSSRQCVKMTPSQIKDRFLAGELKSLNITVEDTVPPRSHEMMDNVSDWIFTGNAITTLGGPLSLSCRKLDSRLMGTFIGFCRNCGCIDTIFGSWSFCQPSKDCQDITMSIFDRRDVLRRYALPEMRRERIKDHLYTRSKYGKLEKAQGEHTSHPHSGSG